MLAHASSSRPGRPAYAAAATIFVTAAVAAAIVDGFVWQLAVFAVAPDLALLAGVGAGLARGQLHPRAVPLYNALHRFVGPAALAVAAAAGLGRPWALGALAWAAHIALDRALGYGLRTREGFQRG